MITTVYIEVKTFKIFCLNMLLIDMHDNEFVILPKGLFKLLTSGKVEIIGEL